MTVAKKVWLNGRIVRASTARISVFDRGFLYGDAVFETVRLYDGKPFLWSRHRQRLRHSLSLFQIPQPSMELQNAIEELATACKLVESAIRITVTRGVGEGLIPPPDLSPTVLLSAREVPENLPAHRSTGVTVIRLPFGNGSQSIVTGHKTTNYATAVQGRILAAQKNAYEAIYVEANDRISEATTSNVFAVFGKTIHTPPLEAGCLPGITRQVVIEIAEAEGFRVRVAPLSAKRLDQANEIFLTGSIIEILPVAQLDENLVGISAPGPVTRRLSRAYDRRVQRHRRQYRTQTKRP